MFCGKCGAQIPDDSIFCYKCGAKLVTLPAENAANTTQPAAQTTYSQPAAQTYAQPVNTQPVYAQPVNPQPTYAQPAAASFNGAARTGQFVREVGKVNIFNGAGAIGVTYGAGFLAVFDDRLELQKTAGTSAGYGISPIAGLAIAAADKRNHPLDVWYFRDIARIYSAKHAGMISKFVVQFKGGKALSFTLAGAKNAAPQVEELVQFMQQFL